MRYIVLFLLYFVWDTSNYSIMYNDPFDLEISMMPLINKDLKVGKPVILEIKVSNISQIVCPESAYKFTLFVNDKLISLDNNTSELMPNESITYTKKAGSFHFIAHQDSSYCISAKIEILKGYKDIDMSNNQIEKIFTVN